jgi:DNA-directed RNA polymerase subunit H (RpoH/RPB5)
MEDERIKKSKKSSKKEKKTSNSNAKSKKSKNDNIVELDENDEPFDGSVLFVQIFQHPFSESQGQNSPFDEFEKKYSNNHIIAVFTEVADKILNVYEKKHNIEIFDETSLLIDIGSVIGFPKKCELLTEKDISHIVNPKFGKILMNDPMARYFRARDGYIRMIRTNMNSGIESYYRKVVNSRPVFKQ